LYLVMVLLMLPGIGSEAVASSSSTSWSISSRTCGKYGRSVQVFAISRACWPRLKHKFGHFKIRNYLTHCCKVISWKILFWVKIENFSKCSFSNSGKTGELGENPESMNINQQQFHFIWITIVWKISSYFLRKSCLSTWWR
jgi:hypothetical protein